MSEKPRSINQFMMKYGLFIPIICVVIFTITDSLAGGWDNWNKNLLSNLLVIGLGIQMTIFGFNHIFFGDRIAEYIGWPKGSPFQFELGIAALGIGVLGILCYWFTGLFWLATIICSSIFLWGCVIGHIRDMVKNKNFKPGIGRICFLLGSANASCINNSLRHLLIIKKNLIKTEEPSQYHGNTMAIVAIISGS